jgi:hypothetical protein
MYRLFMKELSISVINANAQQGRKVLFQTHVPAIHQGIRHKCELWDYKATQKGYLKQHNL